MMIHIKKLNGGTVAINTRKILMVSEGTEGCHIHFVGGASCSACDESYLELIARINADAADR
jgi:hypothetical protein